MLRPFPNFHKIFEGVKMFLDSRLRGSFLLVKPKKNNREASRKASYRPGTCQIFPGRVASSYARMCVDIFVKQI